MRRSEVREALGGKVFGEGDLVVVGPAADDDDDDDDDDGRVCINKGKRRMLQRTESIVR